MILKLNHLQEKVAASAAQDVVATIYSLLEEGHIGKEQFARLQIELDWIQYKQNFRDVVIATEGYNAQGEPAPIMDIHIDTRQVQPGCLRVEMLNAFARAKARANPGTEPVDRLPLEGFQSMRSSVVWEFNKLYWNKLKDWQDATGKRYEQSLPGGQSDGHQPQAIADSAEEFWNRMRNLEARNQLPSEIFLLEIG
ncbi:MAG TPA: hypothetical protein VEV85_10255, partial [Bryobacteraceae bacterium]|nr:hypothetical protein [Bryobacteraceae bacterium]